MRVEDGRKPCASATPPSLGSERTPLRKGGTAERPRFSSPLKSLPHGQGCGSGRRRLAAVFRCPGGLPDRHASCTMSLGIGGKIMDTILIIVVLVLLFGGGGFYWNSRRR